MTAATKSDAVINLAMDTTRAKGRAVIVGDVGLNVQRAIFYRKEIDLLMSTSYGPGRYDSVYEEAGADYPYAYVRWTLNRNMQAYLELVARTAIAVERCARSIVSDRGGAAAVRQAGESRRRPAARRRDPLSRRRDRAADAMPTPRQVRAAIARAVRGAGDQLSRWSAPAPSAPRCWCRSCSKRARLLPSRRSSAAAAAGQQLRARQPRPGVRQRSGRPCCAIPAFQLVVIATRHHDHADQVARALAAGKHVFVEKPLAISWDELAAVGDAYAACRSEPLVMVGFNRRFSPALQKLQGAVADRRAPLIIQYRLNAGYIPLRPLGAWRAGRRPQHRRGVPHVRRVPLPRRCSGVSIDAAADRSRRICRMPATTTSRQPSPTRTAVSRR